MKGVLCYFRPHRQQNKRIRAMTTPNERLKEARINAAYPTAAAAARALGKSEATYSAHENGTRGFGSAVALTYARKFGVSLDWLLAGKTSTAMVYERDTTNKRQLNGGGLPVIGEVRAGAWLERFSFDQEVTEHVPVNRDVRYPDAKQFALRVVGSSMNKVFENGTFAICADWADTGKELADGDLVVLERERGGVFEHTVKRTRILPDRIEFWPESTDRNHQNPVILQCDEDSETRVYALVIGKYLAF